MKHTLSSRLYFAHPGRIGGVREGYQSVRARDLGLDEGWFRDSIAANPELAIGPCRRADLLDDDDEEWFCWGTEVSVNTPDALSIGAMDVLLVSEHGRVGIVETKLSYSSERRRQVLAQVLDYAVHLQGVDIGGLPSIPGPQVDRNHIEDHLSRGDFLLIVAGDELDTRAVRLGTALLGDHVVNQWDLALVDLALYGTAGGVAESEFLIVPVLRHALVAVPRHIVRVEVGEDPRATVRITREVPEGPVEPSRRRWSEKEFFDHLEANPELSLEFRQLAAGLVALVKRFPQRMAAFWGTGDVPSLVVKRNGKGMVELYPRWGTVSFRATKFDDALGRDVADSYRERLAELLPVTKLGRYPTVQAPETTRVAAQLLSVIEKHVEVAESRSS